MKYLRRFGTGVLVGYAVVRLLTDKIHPTVGSWLVSKAESWDLDNAWDVFSTEVEE